MPEIVISHQPNLYDLASVIFAKNLYGSVNKFLLTGVFK